MAKAKRRKADATDRLSEQQKDILLWAYRYEPEPPETAIRAPTLIYVSGDGLPVYRKQPGGFFVPWRSTRFLGRTPTASERANLPVSLKRLDERGLLKRYNITFAKGSVKHVTALEGENDRARTTHIQLTGEGKSLAEALATDNPGAHEGMTRKLELEERKEGIYFARVLVDRERYRELVRTQPHFSAGFENAKKRVEDQAGGDLYRKIKLAAAALVIAFEELEKELKGEYETEQ